jgi:hypothetical protein
MDGELSPESEGPLRAHLKACSDCRSAADQLAVLDRSLRSLVADNAAAARIADRVLSSLSTIQSQPITTAAHGRHSTILAALVATTALAAAVLVLVWPSNRGTKVLAPNQVEITLAKGTINVLPPRAKEWQPLSLPGNALQLVGFQLQTEAASLCEFRCPSGSVVRVDQETQLQVNSPTEIELNQGRLWCSAPKAASLTVVPSSDRKAPSIAMTCQPAGEMEAMIDPPEPVRVIAARGPVRIADASNVVTLESGTLARYSPAGWSEPSGVDALQATEWMLPLLALRGGRDPEFSSQVTGVLSRLGMTKLDYIQEERLVELGSPASIPLIAYLRETPASPDSSKRRRAANIVAQTAAEDSLPDLIELLNDSLPDVRISAARALERLTGLDQGVPPQQWKVDGEPQKAAILRWRDWLKRRP